MNQSRASWYWTDGDFLTLIYDAIFLYAYFVLSQRCEQYALNKWRLQTTTKPPSIVYKTYSSYLWCNRSCRPHLDGSGVSALPTPLGCKRFWPLRWMHTYLRRFKLPKRERRYAKWKVALIKFFERVIWKRRCREQMRLGPFRCDACV
jgi:hypothetical protein